MATTSTNLANAVIKLVAADALPVVLGNMIAGNLVRRDYEPALAQPGSAAFFPGGGEITLTTQAEATFYIPDITKVLAVPDLLRLYMEPACASLSDRIETDLLNEWNRFAYCGSAGEPIAADLIGETEGKLYSASPKANKYLIVHPSVWAMMRRMERFQEFYSARDAGLSPLVNGSVGRIFDFFVFRSGNVRMTGSMPVALHNLAFTRDALGIAMRRLLQPLPGTGALCEYAELGNFGMRVTMAYNPRSVTQQFTIDMLYGVAVLNEKLALEIRT